MLLLACFVRSVGLIEARAAGTAQIHMSAERADLSKVIFGAGICAFFCNNGIHVSESIFVFMHAAPFIRMCVSNHL